MDATRRNKENSNEHTSTETWTEGGGVVKDMENDQR